MGRQNKSPLLFAKVSNFPVKSFCDSSCMPTTPVNGKRKAQWLCTGDFAYNDFGYNDPFFGPGRIPIFCVHSNSAIISDNAYNNGPPATTFFLRSHEVTLRRILLYRSTKYKRACNIVA